MLLNGEHLQDAEGEFSRAVTIDPKFALAWAALAETRLLRGDKAGADLALAKQLEVDPRPAARLFADVNVATASLAAGEAESSWKRLDRIEAEAKKLGLPAQYFIDAIQARLQLREGHADKALALARASAALLAKAELPEGARRGIRQGVMIEVLRTEAASRHAEQVKLALAELEALVKPVAQIKVNASQLQNARGLALFAQGDATGAIVAMKRCLPADFQCQYDLVQTQEADQKKRVAASRRPNGLPGV